MGLDLEEGSGQVFLCVDITGIKSFEIFEEEVGDFIFQKVDLLLEEFLWSLQVLVAEELVKGFWFVGGLVAVECRGRVELHI